MLLRTLVLLGYASLPTQLVVASEPVTVTQKGLSFSSADLTLAKGQAIVFLNDDRTAHNVTVSGEGTKVNGGLQPPGGTVKIPFPKPGIYAVTCGIHPKMKMSVTVK